MCERSSLDWEDVTYVTSSLIDWTYCTIPLLVRCNWAICWFLHYEACGWIWSNAVRSDIWFGNDCDKIVLKLVSCIRMPGTLFERHLMPQLNCPLCRVDVEFCKLNIPQNSRVTLVGYKRDTVSTHFTLLEVFRIFANEVESHHNTIQCITISYTAYQ